MNYTFRCAKCRTTIIREIPINEYGELKDRQKCNNCGSKLERVIEWSGSGAYDSVAGKASWQS